MKYSPNLSSKPIFSIWVIPTTINCCPNLPTQKIYGTIIYTSTQPFKTNLAADFNFKSKFPISCFSSHEYVAVYFRGDCDSNKEIDCDEVLADLETIDEDLDEIGIMMTTTKDTQVAIDNGVREFPAIGLFRNGQFVQFEGESDSEKDILEWLTDEETLKIVGIIDEVNLAMLENILEEQDDTFVFFYEEGDTDAFSILEELEQIDEKLDKQDMPFVKISDKGSIESFGLEDLPVLVYFENGVVC